MKNAERFMQERAYIWAKEGGMVFTHQSTAVHDVKKIVDMMGELMRCKKTPFEIRQGQYRKFIHCSPLGRKFLQCLKADIHRIGVQFPSHRHSPLYTIFKRYARRHHWIGDRPQLEDVESLNQTVMRMRAYSRGPALGKRLGNLRRCERENARACRELLGLLNRQYSKLLVVRLDLEYYSECCPSSGYKGQEIQLCEARRHRDDFLTYLRKGPLSANLAGYIWKMEFGFEKGYHFHIALFFNGQAVCRDINIGDWLGNHWRQEITGGKGMFFNCNKKKEAYEHCGIGMIGRGEKEKWSHLENAVRYLTKVDLYLRFRAPGRTRTFGVGGPYGGIEHQKRPAD